MSREQMENSSMTNTNFMEEFKDDLVYIDYLNL